MVDLIVIGGGPAALAATAYALGKQLNVVMVYEERGGKIGWLHSLVGSGQHPDLPGNELAHLLTRRIMALPDRTINDRVLSVAASGASFRVVTERYGMLHGRTVLIATGATPRQLDVPGVDQLPEDCLRYSIPTYAHLTTGQRVAVIGANTRALTGAAELTETAASVSIVAPNPGVRSTPLGRALGQHARVELLDGWDVTRVAGQDACISVTIEQHGNLRELCVNHIFVALGLTPQSDMVRDLVEIDSYGFILVNVFHETSVPGLFAAGDVSSMFCEHVLAAIGDGTRAAMSAYDYLLAQRLVPAV